MVCLNVILETLELKVDLEPLLSTDIAIWFLVFLCVFTLLSQLRKFVYDCARKDLKNDLLDKQNIEDLA